MCDIGNLIDLTEWDEPRSEEATPEQQQLQESCFKDPYDPFDLVETEACMKGITLKAQVEEKVSGAELHYPDLNNESPPVCMQTQAQAQAPASAPAAAPAAAPVQRVPSNSFQKQLLKLNASRAQQQAQHLQDDSPQFERTILTENLQMLAAESPLKLIEDEEAMSCSANFEEDLKMMRIPILDAMAEEKPLPPPEPKPEPKQSPVPESPDPWKGRDLRWLLQQLKALAHEHVEPTQWAQFDTLIAAITQRIFGCAEPENSGSQTALPFAYHRQGTFDLELQTRKCSLEEEECAPVQPGSKVQDFPDAMVCSAATFDGETRPDLFAGLPARKEAPYMTELVDEGLAQQINKLLEQHSLSKAANDQHSAVILLVNPGAAAATQPAPKAPAFTPPNDVSASAMRRRSSSLSIHDKSKLGKEPAGRKAARQAENLENIQPREARNTTMAAASFRQRRNSFSTTLNPVSSKAPESRRSVMGSRLKAPAIAETTMLKGQGGAKAAIPVKRVVPMMKPLDDNNLLQAPANRSMIPPETPLSSKARPGQKVFSTSTPLPQMRTQRRGSFKPPL